MMKRRIIFYITLITILSIGSNVGLLQPQIGFAANNFSRLAQTNNTICGPMDVVFVIDTTGSMGGAIDNVKAESANLISDIDDASEGDFQLGLVTFKNYVIVDEDMASDNEDILEAAILGLFASGGVFLPEASDEALNTAINGLDADDRPSGGQFGDFDGLWRPEATKILILITDALPGGLDDDYVEGVDDKNAHQVALDAAENSIMISAIFVPTFFDDQTDDIIEIMTDYADTTKGSYIQTEKNGTGTADAIKSIIESCGGSGPTIDLGVNISDTPDPVTSGEILNYTLAVSNTGVADATDVVLTHTLPDEVNYASATPIQGSCAHSDGVITCDLNDLPSAGETSVNVSVTVDPSAVPEITTRASVAAAEVDSNVANNSDFEITTVLVPETGSVTILKKTNPTIDHQFEFMGDLGEFSLTDDGSMTFSNLTIGDYVVAENPEMFPDEYWGLLGVECSGNAEPIVVNLADTQATISVQANEEITCTFYNEQASFYIESLIYLPIILAK